MSLGNGTVTHLHVTPQHRGTPQMKAEVRAIVDAGIDGDIHAQKAKGRRQVLLVDRSMLHAVGLTPGALREQITVDFPDLDRLPAGTELRIGQVRLELTGPCEPCTHIGMLAGVADPAAFQSTLAGRRGMLARVVAIEEDGKIRVGDAIAVLNARERGHR